METILITQMFLIMSHGNMIFLDQIQEYPKVCVVAGDEQENINQMNSSGDS